MDSALMLAGFSGSIHIFFVAQNTACLILTFTLPQEQEHVSISLQYCSSFCKYQRKFLRNSSLLHSYKMTELKTYLFFYPLNFLLSISLVCLQCYNVHVVSLRIMISNEKQFAEIGKVLKQNRGDVKTSKSEEQGWKGHQEVI